MMIDNNPHNQQPSSNYSNSNNNRDNDVAMSKMSGSSAQHAGSMGGQQNFGSQNMHNKPDTEMVDANMSGQQQQQQQPSQASNSDNQGGRSQKPKQSSPPGWSRRYAAPQIQVEDPSNIVYIPETQTGTSAAVRATRGFNKGVHQWTIQVKVVSDYSYVGFVDDQWCTFTQPIGKSSGSWGIASNGIRHENRYPQAEVLKEIVNGSTVEFMVDMDKKTCHVKIDGVMHENVFRNLPNVVYPAVSNGRSQSKYVITF